MTAMIFRDRADAGRQLAAALSQYKGKAVVFALPRGGVAVAAEVAEALDAPLDLVLVRKIGVPFHPELAMGAVVDGGSPTIVRNEDVITHAGVSEARFTAVAERELEEIERRRKLYLGGARSLDPKGRVAIVIDDGIATGATVRAAMRALRGRHPARLVLAVPVAPADSLAELRDEADEIVCLASPEPFGAVGYFYRDFRQLEDADVIGALERLSHPGRVSAPAGQG
jgi:predicted phosphoribosyltransferase